MFFVVFGLSQAILIFRHYYARLFCSGLSLAFLALAGLFLLAKKVNKKVLLTLLFVCLIFSLIAVFFRISCLVSTLNNHDFSQYEGYDYFGNYYSNIEQYRYNEIFDTAKMALFPIAVIIMLVYLAVSLRHKDDENCFKRNWFIPGLLYFFFAFVAQTARYGYYNGDVTACFFTAALLLFCYWIYRDYNESFRIPVKGRTNRSSAGNAVNVAAKLRAIQDLYINGKLSDDEYEAWRRQILGS